MADALGSPEESCVGVNDVNKASVAWIELNRRIRVAEVWSGGIQSCTHLQFIYHNWSDFYQSGGIHEVRNLNRYDSMYNFTPRFCQYAKINKNKR